MCVRTEPGEERARGNAAPDCENEQRSHYVGWGQVRSEGSNCRGDKPERCELALYFYNLTSDLSPLTKSPAADPKFSFQHNLDRFRVCHVFLLQNPCRQRLLV